ncbi:hypothetical protein BC936DRAFT_141112 [Jimgerdemannia flammicorona]|uniref:Uncharacterized protein n=1 Tax=Jimgerdemannia flammicorona TaxID=994334 RepID=A0A433A2U9_9FUNG|nr:hypothetical protein BC936DRAFT_141112 [Jimgerdemannia flammicorona]
MVVRMTISYAPNFVLSGLSNFNLEGSSIYILDQARHPPGRTPPRPSQFLEFCKNIHPPWVTTYGQERIVDNVVKTGSGASLVSTSFPLPLQVQLHPEPLDQNRRTSRPSLFEGGIILVLDYQDIGPDVVIFEKEILWKVIPERARILWVKSLGLGAAEGI